jgi:predicted dienelactone hydrolase
LSNNGESLPLIVLSHGAGGSYEYLRDTAEALADGG